MTPSIATAQPSLQLNQEPLDAQGAFQTTDVGIPDVTEIEGNLLTNEPTGIPTQSTALSGPGKAPILTAPGKISSPDEMMELLESLFKTMEEGQLKGTLSGIQSDSIKNQKALQKQQDKIKDWIKKSKEADAAASKKGKWGLIGKIFAVVAAVVAVVVAAGLTPLSAGVSAPLLALACVALATATLSLADHIVQSKGGPEISLTSGLTKLTALMLTQFGIPKEKAEKLSGVVTGSICFAMCPGMFLIEPGLASKAAEGFCQLGGLDESKTAIITMVVGIVAAVVSAIVLGIISGKAPNSENLTNVARNIKIINAVTTGTAQATTQIGQGVVGLDLAYLDRDVQRNLASRKELQAFMENMSQLMEAGREEVKKLLEQIQDLSVIINNTLQESSDSRLQVIRNQPRVTA